MKSLFITGTDTGVGKTIISASLCAFLSLMRHFDTGVMKPFESGLPKAGRDHADCDGRTLRIASGSTDTFDDITPYSLEAPLAPEAAAGLENLIIDLDIVDETYRKLLGRHDVLVVEGAGGVLVPITEKFFFVDLIKRWNIPVLVVGRLGLGTINHTLLTTSLLKSRGVKVLGVILNDSGPKQGIAEKTNPEIVRKYLDVPFLGVYPHLEQTGSGTPERQLLAETFARYINTEALLSHLEVHS